MKIRSRYDFVDDSITGLTCNAPSLTQQHFKDECDINNIVARCAATGTVDPSIIREGVYADVSQIPDYLTSLNIVAEADEKFNALPSVIRKRFDNNPANMLEFLQDSSNYDEAVRLGLIVPKSTPITPDAPQE